MNNYFADLLAQDVKVRITFFSELFPENSPDYEVIMNEGCFRRLVQSFECYYDEDMDMYYSKDNKVGLEMMELVAEENEI